MTNSKKILIIDDDEGILDAISMVLEYKGYTVDTSKNGNSILDLKEDMPDLVLLDIWMSGVDGRNVCRQLKQHPQTRAIPVIMISASKDIERSAIESGADSFLAKPFEMRELLKKIETFTADVL